MTLGKAYVSKFSDGEMSIQIKEKIQGSSVFIMQSTCTPVNDNLMELILMIDAVRRASASRITAVIPYFGYARQDRRTESSMVPISAKVVASMLSFSGADRVLTVDLHSEKIQGFFDIPIDNLPGSQVLLGDITRKNYHRPLVVAPDVGGITRARAIADQLNTDLAIIDKCREKANELKVMHIIGEVTNRTCILIDDICDTAKTLCESAKFLKLHGAQKVVAYATHPVLSGDAVNNIQKSTLDELVVTDTIPLSSEATSCNRIRQISLSSLLIKSLRAILNEELS
jgi:ribose-phosphate pyrophosphokinase